MEAASTSKTSVNFYQTTRRNIPEDSHLHTHRRENRKYQQILDIIIVLYNEKVKRFVIPGIRVLW
jgi:hypothetical protein